jgi:3-methyladenine DNA glycosylase/8-oxoguanine DNA glycosylase
MPRRTIKLDRPFDLFPVLGPLRRGSGDPTTRLAAGAFERASMTPDGPATISLRVVGLEVEAEAWGAGADRLLDSLPAFLGLDDDDAGFEPGHHPVVADLARRHGAVRLGRTGFVLDVLVPAILEQRITGTEAWRGYRRLVLAHGEPAPGPTRLRVAPPPHVLASLPSWAWPQLGIEPRRGTLLRRVARDAERLERLAEPARGEGNGGIGAAALAERLRAYPGIGPWTAAEVTLRALGDPDAVSVGDAHLSHVVSWSLAGEPRGTDERMLELLEPWLGHRARVIRLLESSGRMPPRYGPRIAPRDLTELSPRPGRRFTVAGYRGRDG